MDNFDPIKNPVIVGAGPAGLYFAIRLAQMGVKNITIIDPRKKDYVRTNFISSNHFTYIEKFINRSLPCQKNQMKELERSLSDIALSRGIKIEGKKFKNFGKKSIEALDANGETSSIPCDLAVDATGVRRELLVDVNKRTG